MAFQLMNWINGITKLNKTTMDTFQNNIKNQFDIIDTDIEDINQSISNIDTGITSTITKYSNGYVIKYSNGVMEQVKIITMNISTINTWGNFFVTSDLDMGTWFESFNDNPVTYYRIYSDLNAVIYLEKGKPSPKQISPINIGRIDNKTFDVTIYIYGKGFWKEPTVTTTVSETSNNEN